MKTVFLTGATGNMGWAGFSELYKKQKFNIRILARDSKKNRKLLKPYMNDSLVTIIWGDLMKYEDVLEGVRGSDYVLHVGGMVSPAADYYPEKTLKVNTTAAQNVVKAVLAQPNNENIKVAYIGSVSQYGDRRKPVHWGAAGDPSFAGPFDMYAVSKCKAERIIVDSGIKKWVSLRQTAILYPAILKAVNSTVFHVPLAGVLEWVTIEDSGRLLANLCEDSVPEEFWNHFYNVSSGKDYRLSNYEFENLFFDTLGLPSMEKCFEPQWFALKNFHGMWYKDADILEDYLHFRANIPVKDYFQSMKKRLPWYFSLSFLAPAFAIKLFMKQFTEKDSTCTQYWVKNNTEKFAAYYGSREEYDNIKSWDDVRPVPMEKDYELALQKGDVVELDRGYDRTCSIYELTAEQLQSAAQFRGGHFLGPKDKIGTPGVIFDWECEHGHHFQASLESVLEGGAWCDECNVGNVYVETSPKNKFISQVSSVQH